jgi:hypothetical protein
MYRSTFAHLHTDYTPPTHEPASPRPRERREVLSLRGRIARVFGRRQRPRVATTGC